MWKVESGIEIANYDGDGSFPAVGFSADGKILHVTQDEDSIRVLDLRTGEQHTTLNGFSAHANSAIFSPDMATVASGGKDKLVRMRDVKTWKLRHTLKGHTEGIYSLLFSPDSSTLLTISNTSREILLWDVKTGKHKITAFQFSPEGKTLASCGGEGDQIIHLWETRTGKQKKPLLGI